MVTCFFWNTLYIRDNVHGVDGGWTTSDVGKRRIYDGLAVSFTVAFQQQNTDAGNWNSTHHLALNLLPQYLAKFLWPLRRTSDNLTESSINPFVNSIYWVSAVCSLTLKLSHDARHTVHKYSWTFYTQTTSTSRHTEPRLTPHCRVLPPGELNGMILKPLPVSSDSFVTLVVTVFPSCCNFQW